MLTIIESGSQAWAFAAADGDLHIYSRAAPGEWTEVLLSEDSEQIDQDGSAILEAAYEQYAATDQNGQTAAHDDEQEEPENKPEPLADEEEPEDEEESLEDEEQPDEEEEPLEDEEEEKPRRSPARSRAKKR